MEIPKELEFLDREPGQWCWCLHCERCYKWGEYRYELTSELFYCPYDDCDGDVVFDNWPWEKVAEIRGYPSEPERGKVYSLY